MYLIIILDEAHVLGVEQLLSLINSTKHQEFEKARISTILIERSSRSRSMLSQGLNECLNDKIRINDYIAEEMKEILTYRTKVGFLPNVISDDILEVVVKKAMEVRNVKYGLEMLYHAGKLAFLMGKDQITHELIESSQNHLYPKLKDERLRGLTYHELLTLFGIAKRLNHTGISATTINEAFDYYCVECKSFQVVAHAKPSYRRHVSALAEREIIIFDIQSIRRGRRGRRGRIVLVDIPAKVMGEYVKGFLFNYENDSINTEEGGD